VCMDERSAGVPSEMFCADHRPEPKIDVVEAAKVEVAKAMYEATREIIRYERHGSERLRLAQLHLEVLSIVLASWGWKWAYSVEAGESRWVKL
jgi:hypothetical protein